MNNYLAVVNSGIFYLVVAAVLLFITLMCVVFLIKSFRAGLAIGMDKELLKKTMNASATFTLLPSISILLGVIALSGTLGVPLSWLRLSVIGALQYELNVAEIAAQSVGLSGLTLSELNIEAFVTIALVMTVGILGGVVCCIFFLKRYTRKLNSKPKITDNAGESKPGFGAHATTAMFVGLCAAYIGSYIGKLMPGGGADWMPLAVAGMAAAAMSVFEYLIQKKNMLGLENYSLAASMLVAMAGAVGINMLV
ncbi:MAG: DUF5058 family protein [Firmicutes bacterium]|nr:DUF5058 family protein [Bacillota bacterium]